MGKPAAAAKKQGRAARAKLAAGGRQQAKKVQRDGGSARVWAARGALGVRVVEKQLQSGKTKKGSGAAAGARERETE